MTTYTTITNAEIDQDSPVTQPLMTALRDNPLAIAEGGPNAPELAVMPRTRGTLSASGGETALTITGLDAHYWLHIFANIVVNYVNNTGYHVEISNDNGSNWVSTGMALNVTSSSLVTISALVFSDPEGSTTKVAGSTVTTFNNVSLSGPINAARLTRTGGSSTLSSSSDFKVYSFCKEYN